jgi:pyruvate kinase
MLRRRTFVKGENAEIKLATGAEITVTTDPHFKDQCDESHLWIDYSNLVKVIEVGKRILISDGLIALVVLEKGDTATNVEPMPPLVTMVSLTR